MSFAENLEFFTKNSGFFVIARLACKLCKSIRIFVAIHNARSAFLATRNANRKNKVKNEAKRFDPSEKIAVRRLRFARGQPR